MLNIYKVPTEEVTKIEWKDNFLEYDRQLSQLGNGHEEFLVVNPEFEETELYKTIDSIPPTPGVKCLVWKFNGKWIAKYFHKSWTPDMGHWPVMLASSYELVWEKNPDISDDIPFLNDPTKIPLTNLEYLPYQMIWYMDPTFNPTNDKIWVMKCSLKASISDKDKIGYVSPVDMGYISPKVRIKYNPDIPKIDFDLRFLIPWYDLKYEHVWYLDERFNPTEDKIWAIKLKLMNGIPKQAKDMGYVSPTIIYNPELPVLDYTIEDHIPYYDLVYEQVWTVDERLVNSYEEVWAAKIVPHEPEGVKVVGNIKCNLPEQLDVVFISYNEPNAEANWQKVLAKAPDAKRVNGVKGIVAAHKKAAEIVTTDMFYVVDGDAELADYWDFKFQPNLFDRDCVHVWRSINPVNDLKYGYGGVKLFPTKLVISANPNNTDMTTSLSDKFKLMPKISNTTAFNSDEFSTWRSSFRECAKLAGKVLKRQQVRETEKRLDIWCTLGKDKPFGKYAIAGAIAGRKFGEENQGNDRALQKVNDYDWLKSKFNENMLNNIDG
jgi:hypothetical protein